MFSGFDILRQVGEVLVLPLYSSLPMDRQRAIFDPAPPPRGPDGPPGRKVRFCGIFASQLGIRWCCVSFRNVGLSGHARYADSIFHQHRRNIAYY